MQFSLKYLLAGFSLIATFIFVATVIPWGQLLTVGTKERRVQHEMRPAIEAIDKFVRENGRVPDHYEVEKIEEITRAFALHLKSENEFVIDRGGTHANDYILGSWYGEWIYCYQSWNGEFFHDYDSRLYTSSY